MQEHPCSSRFLVFRNRSHAVDTSFKDGRPQVRPNRSWSRCGCPLPQQPQSALRFAGQLRSGKDSAHLRSARQAPNGSISTAEPTPGGLPSFAVAGLRGDASILRPRRSSSRRRDRDGHLSSSRCHSDYDAGVSPSARNCICYPKLEFKQVAVQLPGAGPSPV